MTFSDPRAAFAADASAEVASAFAGTILRFLHESAAGELPVAPAATPAQIAQRFDEPLPRAGRPLREVLQRVERDVLADANHLSHPMYVGHQVSAPLPTGVWADALISALNNSLAVNEMSPTLSHVERRVVRWMCDLVGWDASAGGTFTSGGTEASFTALLAARASVMPNAWRDGVGADPPVLLCGEHTHYAVSRAAGELGLGMRSVISVPGEAYHMSPGALRARLLELGRAGRPVLAVAATAGQTATGAFDDLEAIGRICQEFGVWLHVDGAHGASALLSPSHRHRMRGIERASSLAWDPHKMMFLPLAAGTVLVRDVRWLDVFDSQGFINQALGHCGCFVGILLLKKRRIGIEKCFQRVVCSGKVHDLGEEVGLRIVVNTLLRVAKRSANEPCVIFSKFPVSTLDEDGVDGFGSVRFLEHPLDLLGLTVNDGVVNPNQTTFGIALFPNLDVLQIRERNKFCQGRPPVSFVGGLHPRAIMPEQSLFVGPIVRSKKGRAAIAFCFDFAHKDFGLFQRSVSVVQRVHETCFGQHSHEGPAISLIISHFCFRRGGRDVRFRQICFFFE